MSLLPRVSAILALIACVLLVSRVHGRGVRNTCVKRHGRRGRMSWNTEYYPYFRKGGERLSLKHINGEEATNILNVKGWNVIPEHKRLSRMIDLRQVRAYQGSSYYRYNCRRTLDMIAKRRTGLCHLLNSKCRRMSREYLAHGCLSETCAGESAVTIRVRITCDGEKMVFSVDHNTPGRFTDQIAQHLPKRLRHNAPIARYGLTSRINTPTARYGFLPRFGRARNSRRGRKLLQRQQGHC